MADLLTGLQGIAAGAVLANPPSAPAAAPSEPPSEAASLVTGAQGILAGTAEGVRGTYSSEEFSLASEEEGEENPDPNGQGTLQEVGTWLKQSVRLPQYCGVFHKECVDGETLMDLDKDALGEMGVKLMGHRMKILRYAHNFPAWLKKQRGLPDSPTKVPDVAGPAVLSASAPALRGSIVAARHALGMKIDPPPTAAAKAAQAVSLPDIKPPMSSDAKDSSVSSFSGGKLVSYLRGVGFAGQKDTDSSYSSSASDTTMDEDEFSSRKPVMRTGSLPVISRARTMPPPRGADAALEPGIVLHPYNETTLKPITETQWNDTAIPPELKAMSASQRLKAGSGLVMSPDTSEVVIDKIPTTAELMVAPLPTVVPDLPNVEEHHGDVHLGGDGASDGGDLPRSRAFRRWIECCCRNKKQKLLVLVLTVIMIAAMILTVVKFPDFYAGGTLLWRWLAWVVEMMVLFGVFHFVSNWIGDIVGHSALQYYFSGLGTTMHVLFWNVVQYAAWGPILDEYSSSTATVVPQLIILVFYLSGLYTVKCILVKFAVMTINRKIFWNKLTTYVKREHALRTLNVLREFSSQFLSDFPVDLDETRHKTGQFLELWAKVLQSARHVRRVHVRREKAVEAVEKLYVDIKCEQKGYIELEDVTGFLNGENMNAREVFGVLDVNQDGRVTKEEAVSVLMQQMKDEKSLLSSLYDRNSIGSVVDNIFTTLYLFLMCVIALIIFGVPVQSLLVSLGTFTVSLAFIFGNSIKTMWESFMLIFFIRPYDVGDRIEISTYGALTVHKIHLLTTEAFARDGRRYIIPNSKIFIDTVIQYQRSNEFHLNVVYLVKPGTKPAQLMKLSTKLQDWLVTDPAPWKTKMFSFNIKEVQASHVLALDMWVGLRNINWSDALSYEVPRTRFIAALQAIASSCGIE